MILSEPAGLPSTINSQQAERIARFLRLLDESATHPISLAIYGSAAVALLTADEDSEYGFTRDIDVAKSSESVDALKVNSTAVEPPLEFQFYDVERWLVHPDWRESVVEFSPLLRLTSVSLATLHPLDLITTKLERAGDRDIEDGIRLKDRYGLCPETASVRVVEAASHYALSSRAANNIAYSFECIFDTKFDLSSLL